MHVIHRHASQRQLGHPQTTDLSSHWVTAESTNRWQVINIHVIPMWSCDFWITWASTIVFNTWSRPNIPQCTWTCVDTPTEYYGTNIVQLIVTISLYSVYVKWLVMEDTVGCTWNVWWNAMLFFRLWWQPPDLVVLWGVEFASFTYEQGGVTLSMTKALDS